MVGVSWRDCNMFDRDDSTMVGVKSKIKFENFFLNCNFLRIMYSSERRMDYTDTIGQRRTNSFLAFAIIATLATIVICLVVLVLRKRIQLVIALFKEAGKALGNMPLLLLEPILV